MRSLLPGGAAIFGVAATVAGVAYATRPYSDITKTGFAALALLLAGVAVSLGVAALVTRAGRATDDREPRSAAPPRATPARRRPAPRAWR